MDDGVVGLGVIAGFYDDGAHIAHRGTLVQVHGQFAR